MLHYFLFSRCRADYFDAPCFIFSLSFCFSSPLMLLILRCRRVSMLRHAIYFIYALLFLRLFLHCHAFDADAFAIISLFDKCCRFSFHCLMPPFRCRHFFADAITLSLIRHIAPPRYDYLFLHLWLFSSFADYFHIDMPLFHFDADAADMPITPLISPHCHYFRRFSDALLIHCRWYAYFDWCRRRCHYVTLSSLLFRRCFSLLIRYWCWCFFMSSIDAVILLFDYCRHFSSLFFFTLFIIFALFRYLFRLSDVAMPSLSLFAIFFFAIRCCHDAAFRLIRCRYTPLLLLSLILIICFAIFNGAMPYAIRQRHYFRHIIIFIFLQMLLHYCRHFTYITDYHCITSFLHIVWCHYFVYLRQHWCHFLMSFHFEW